ncbi:hypothetical protein CEXT_323821 [Caerostris extrusa]|uniref:LAGLIDADG homing endonuclease n=1 Tax=Caerostris extrusa TaxID=172846 RepID=A0AAV4QKG4_CAEEX|nr:hypothetical protein CEXT_323821 [Caerostris extrusa]
MREGLSTLNGLISIYTDRSRAHDIFKYRVNNVAPQCMVLILRFTTKQLSPQRNGSSEMTEVKINCEINFVKRSDKSAHYAMVKLILRCYGNSVSTFDYASNTRIKSEASGNDRGEHKLWNKFCQEKRLSSHYSDD